MMNGHAVAATWRRQLFSLLSNPLAYVFILAFVMATALIMFMGDDFFKRNIADFEPLRMYMLYPLVVLIPALAMGSWASERELGTEEQLLSLPMTLADILIGKWLGIATFFTITLACSWCNVFILSWLGDPDIGLIISHYVGWWFAGLFFVSLSILASCLVGMPAIAFVLGIVFSAVGALALEASAWLDPFERGLFPVPSILMTVLLVLAPLGVAGVCLSMRRWQAKHSDRFVNLIVAAFCLCIVAFNVIVLLDRLALDVDITEERLSTISPASKDVIKNIERHVDVIAYISTELPSTELENKAREVETMLQSIDRLSGKKITVEIKRPKDALDDMGVEASEHYGLQARRVLDDSVSGKQEVEVFLGAVVRSAAKTQIIGHFDPGLSVEYELTRAIRAVGHQERKVIGVVESEFNVIGGFDYQSGQMRKGWDLISELSKQYEIKQVALNGTIEGGIDVLLVIQPSRLKEEQIRELHDAIWSGMPALIMEDPMPIFAGPQLGSSQAKKPPQQNPMQPQQPPPEPKGDLQPLIRALGLTYIDSEVMWSTYNPSHEFRGMPKGFVWTYKDAEGVSSESAICTGIDGLLLPFPGAFDKSMVPAEGLTITPLLSSVPQAQWGRNTWDDHFQQSYFGLQQKQPPYRPSFGSAPMIAVEVAGAMKRAYAGVAPVTDVQAETEVSEESAEEAAKEGATNSLAKGTASAKPVHVVLIADTDLAHDQFYSIYRNENSAYTQEAMQVFHGLRNVQFIANAVDALAGDQDFLELRTRRAQLRPLQWVDHIVQRQRNERTIAVNEAELGKIKEIKALNDRLQEKLESVKALSEDVNAKNQRLAQVEKIEGRRTKQNIERVNRKMNKVIKEADVKERRAIQTALSEVKMVALGAPAIVLLILIMIVFVVRMREEQAAVPRERKRSDA